MTHVFGVPLQDDKKLWVVLAQIPGVGRKKSLFICRHLGFSPQVLFKNLSLKQKDSLGTWLQKSVRRDGIFKGASLGVQFWQEQKKRKEFLIKLGTRRGIRLRQGLPVRGQKTHSNARTARRSVKFLAQLGF